MHRAIITYSSPGQTDVDVRYVITKFSRMDGLPNFITHGAPLARFARGSSANSVARMHDVKVTNLQFLSEFCHFSYVNDKRQTNMTF